MTNEDMMAANELVKVIDDMRDILSRIEKRGMVSLSADNIWISGMMPDTTIKVIRTIVEAELMDQLEKLESQLEAL